MGLFTHSDWKLFLYLWYKVLKKTFPWNFRFLWIVCLHFLPLCILNSLNCRQTLIEFQLVMLSLDLDNVIDSLIYTCSTCLFWRSEEISIHVEWFLVGKHESLIQSMTSCLCIYSCLNVFFFSCCNTFGSHWVCHKINRNTFSKSILVYKIKSLVLASYLNGIGLVFE